MTGNHNEITTAYLKEWLNLQRPSADEDVEQLEFSLTAGGNENTLEKLGSFLKN